MLHMLAELSGLAPTIDGTRTLPDTPCDLFGRYSLALELHHFVI
jgi:hypothetical protein